MAQNAENFFQKFMEAVDNQKDVLKGENEFIATTKENEKKNDINEENIFKQKTSDEQKLFKTEKAALEKELKVLKSVSEKLVQTKTVWEDELETTNEEFMLRLDDQKTIDTEKQFRDTLECLIESLDCLSVQAMDTQLVDIRKTLHKLNDERKTRSQNLNENRNVETEIKNKLMKSYGASYAERNILQYAINNKTSKVRQEYQKTRLQEESLKAKLSH
ncbi:unnamed protein product [Caenorhabditis angaria]|uniref:Uncharacterized protein n=1 Tax=Caenorhabditis angaria TaxID=860376 RepID=A0A9P1MSU6_9PELO|nr:unnamed protein product [Caenorhabditis angaria]